MNLNYRVSWFFLRIVIGIYFRWRAHNPWRVPQHGPVILASNHASFIDPLLIGSALPREVFYLARSTLFKVPVVGRLIRSWNSLPVDRDGSGGGLRTVLDQLALGHAVLVFPEGTRTPDGSLQAARSGIGLAILKSTAPVIPVRVFGTYEAFGRHIRFPRPRRLAVKFGPPLNFEMERREARVCSRARLKELYQEASEKIMNAIGDLRPWEDKVTFP